MKNYFKAMGVMKSLAVAYIISGIFILILSLLLYNFNVSGDKISMAVLLVYTISNFAGGFISGKIIKVHKYVWGLLVGVLYFGILLLISIGVSGEIGNNVILTVMLICMSSGMLGGMLS